MMQSKQRQLFITGAFPVTPELLSLFPGHINHCRQVQSLDDIAAGLEVATDYILGGPEYLDRSLMMASPHLHRVVVMGTGTSSFVDEVASEEFGVKVVNTPGLNAEAVAEFALGILITAGAEAFTSRDACLLGSGSRRLIHKSETK